MKLLFRNEAENDLNEIYDYIKLASFCLEISQNQVRKIMNTTKNLQTFPAMGKVYGGDDEGVRIFSSHKQFSIIYKFDATKIEILRIFYKGRDF